MYYVNPFWNARARSRNKTINDNNNEKKILEEWNFSWGWNDRNSHPYSVYHSMFKHVRKLIQLNAFRIYKSNCEKKKFLNFVFIRDRLNQFFYRSIQNAIVSSLYNWNGGMERAITITTTTTKNRVLLARPINKYSSSKLFWPNIFRCCCCYCANVFLTKVCPSLSFFLFAISLFFSGST